MREGEEEEGVKFQFVTGIVGRGGGEEELLLQAWGVGDDVPSGRADALR